ncbi:MAG: hypothetical protein V3S68_03200 [Dehalococcoidia bacterium]
MLRAVFEIRLVKENLDLSVALMQAVQDEKVTAKQIFRDGPEETFVAFAVNKDGPDQAELARRVANQARAAFVLSVIQTQRSLDRVFSRPPIEEENPDLQAARCVVYLLHKAVAPNLFSPVWDCPPPYRRWFEVRPINLMVDAAELHGKGLTWDHVGGLHQFLDLLEFLANRIKILPELDSPVVTAEDLPAAQTVAARTVAAPPEPILPEPVLEAQAPEEPELPEVPANLPPADSIDGPVARFIAERCDLGSHIRTTAKELYAGFLEWCRETGQEDVSQRSFGMQLTAIGLYRRRRGRGKHWWEGIRLKGSMGETAGRVTGGNLELMNGHREGYQPELAP